MGYSKNQNIGEVDPKAYCLRKEIKDEIRLGWTEAGLLCINIVSVDRTRSSSVIDGPETGCTDESCKSLDTTSLVVSHFDRDTGDLHDRTLPSTDDAGNEAFLRLLCETETPTFCPTRKVISIRQTRVYHECFDNFVAAIVASEQFNDPEKNWTATTFGHNTADKVLKCLCAFLKERSTEKTKATKIWALVNLLVRCAQDRIDDCGCTNTIDYDTESYVLERFGATVLSYALGGPAGAAAVNLVWQIVSSYSDSQSELMALCMGDLLNSLDCD